MYNCNITTERICMFPFASLKKRQIGEYLVKSATSSNLDRVSDKSKLNNVIS